MRIAEPKRRFANFEEFWSFYLSEHSRQGTRALHFLGTSLGLICLVTGILRGSGWLVLLGFALGYLLAWTGHFLIEKNRPATFQHPLLSFLADLRLWFYMLSGKRLDELDRRAG